MTDESTMSQETNALQVVTELPGNEGKLQVLNQSSWIVTPVLGSDGDLLILPVCQASTTVDPIPVQRTASVMEELIAVSIKPKVIYILLIVLNERNDQFFIRIKSGLSEPRNVCSKLLR